MSGYDGVVEVFDRLVDIDHDHGRVRVELHGADLRYYASNGGSLHWVIITAGDFLKTVALGNALDQLEPDIRERIECEVVAEAITYKDENVDEWMRKMEKQAHAALAIPEDIFK